MNSLYIAIGVIALFFFGRKILNSGTQYPIQEVSATEAKDMIKKGAIALDVRTPGEVSHGKIKGALTINVTSPGFKSEVSKLDKTKSYVVYCRSGRRSMNACNIMKSSGFEQVVNLRGGYNAWK